MTDRSDTRIAEMQAAWRRGRGLLVWAFAFSVLVNLLMLTGPLYMLAIYDQVLVSRSVDMLVALTVLVLALYLLMAVLDYARGRVMARIGARFQTHLDARLFDVVLHRLTLISIMMILKSGLKLESLKVTLTASH